MSELSLAKRPPDVNVAHVVDVVILGGGLSGGLCALAIAEHAPLLRMAMVEQSPRLAGNHTWCCHASDLGRLANTSGGAWFWPLVKHRWPQYLVAFPGFARTIDGDYCCVPADALESAVNRVMARPTHQLLLGERVQSATSTQVLLESGRRLQARLVLDARGSRTVKTGCGYQKFLGWEIESDEAARTLGNLPTLMDARVQQLDGYRFVYVLPLSSTRFLIEDTYFSRDSLLDLEAVAGRLRQYLDGLGVGSYRLLREESGVLPMPWNAGDQLQDVGDVEDAPVAIGYRAGLFHPATGYSLGLAAQTADNIARAIGTARTDDLRYPAASVVAALRTQIDTNLRFAHALNFLAFRAIPASWLRSLVFEAVYRLPQALLERFYAARTTARDRLVLLGAVARLTAPRFDLAAAHSTKSTQSPHLNGETS